MRELPQSSSTFLHQMAFSSASTPRGLPSAKRAPSDPSFSASPAASGSPAFTSFSSPPPLSSFSASSSRPCGSSLPFQQPQRPFPFNSRGGGGWYGSRKRGDCHFASAHRRRPVSSRPFCGDGPHASAAFAAEADTVAAANDFPRQAGGLCSSAGNGPAGFPPASAGRSCAGATASLAADTAEAVPPLVARAAEAAGSEKRLDEQDKGKDEGGSSVSGHQWRGGNVPSPAVVGRLSRRSEQQHTEETAEKEEEAVASYRLAGDYPARQVATTAATAAGGREGSGTATSVSRPNTSQSASVGSKSSHSSSRNSNKSGYSSNSHSSSNSNKNSRSVPNFMPLSTATSSSNTDSLSNPTPPRSNSNRGSSGDKIDSSRHLPRQGAGRSLASGPGFKFSSRYRNSRSAYRADTRNRDTPYQYYVAVRPPTSGAAAAAATLSTATATTEAAIAVTTPASAATATAATAPAAADAAGMATAATAAAATAETATAAAAAEAAATATAPAAAAATATATGAAAARPQCYDSGTGYDVPSTSQPRSACLPAAAAAGVRAGPAAAPSSFPPFYSASHRANRFPLRSHVAHPGDGGKGHRGRYGMRSRRPAALAARAAHAAAREAAAAATGGEGALAAPQEEGEDRETAAAAAREHEAAGEEEGAARDAGAAAAAGEAATQPEDGPEEVEEEEREKREVEGTEEKEERVAEFSSQADEANADDDWTLQEQKKLEEALIFYRRMRNRAEMWKLIGTFVSSKTPQQCLRRFKLCRQAALQRVQETACTGVSAAEEDAPAGATADDAVLPASEEKQPSDSSGAAAAVCRAAATETATSFLPASPPAAAGARGAAPGAPAAAAAPSTSDARAAAQQRLLRAAAAEGSPQPQQQILRGITVVLRSPKFEGISAVHLSALKLLVVCSRCNQPADVKVSPAGDWTTLAVAGTTAECGTCHLQMRLRAVPRIFFAAGGVPDSVAAAVEAVQCGVRDLLPSDYLLTCACCSAATRAREVFSGSCRTTLCRNCHMKLTFSFQSAYVEGGDLSTSSSSSAAAAAGGAAATENLAMKQKKKKQDFVFKVGTPLPDNGACKHYKKSFRWLRFPCCGKAYACDICHDDAADHEHTWATRMICGFCSREQPYASSKPCQACGHSVIKDGKSAHWEGGRGCRDATRMSRRDPKKYKLLHKQSRMAGASSKN